MEKIYSLVESQNFQSAINELTEMLKINIDEPSLEVLELLNQILGLSQKRQDLQIAVLKLAKQQKTEHYSNLILNLARIYIDLGQLDQAKQQLNKLKNINNQQLKCILKEYDRMFDQEKIDVSKEEQLKRFYELQEEEKNLEYNLQDGLFCYLIPTSWFQKWRFYTSNQDQTPQEDPTSELDFTQLKNILEISDDTINEESDITPGPIDGSKLIKLKWNILPNKKKHLNFLLRDDLREGVDFVLVSQKIFKYFESVYGAFEVKRQIVKPIEQEKVIVDLAPRIVEFIYLEDQLQYAMLLGWHDQTLDLTKNLQFSKAIKNEAQWWRFKNLQHQQNWHEMFKRGSLIKSIKGKVLDSKMRLEDISLSQEEFLICEIKSGQQWSLTEDQDKQIQQEQSVSQLLNRFGISDAPRERSESRKGMTGLQNLGNTCFMNAALQCLSNTYEFTEYMVSNKFAHHLNPNNVLGTKGYLATSYAELLKNMWYGTYQSVSAIDLKRVIGKFAPQFYGYGQQDSHEFLSYLLDGLHEDLNRVFNKPIVTDIEITNETDLQASEKFWMNYTLRNQSKIQQLMVGQYKSTLVCPICNRLSKTFDPFMSLSLPIPNYQSITLSLYLIFQDTESTPSKISLSLTSDMNAFDMLKILEQNLTISHQKLNMVLIKDHKIRERVTYEKNIKYINDHDGILFVQEVAANLQNIKSHQINIDYFYVQKGQKVYEEKTLTFARQIVLDRSLQIQELYGEIYQKFRVHFQLAIKEMNQQDFPIKDEFLAMSKPNSLKEYQDEFQILCNQRLDPFILRIKNFNNSGQRELSFADINKIEFQGQNVEIDVLFSDYLSKYLQNLKLQRCKELNLNDQKKQQIKKGEYDLNDCLRAFTKEEILGVGDEWYCNKCKKHVQASKKMEIYKAPQILIVHLKRFKTNKINNYGNFYFSGGTQKITTMVYFPLELDLNSFVLSKEAGDNLNYVYDLYGVDNHYGGLGGGHYTATAFNSVANKWVEYNDSNSRVTSSNVVSEAAYLLFYRRRDSEKCQMFK